MKKLVAALSAFLLVTACAQAPKQQTASATEAQSAIEAAEAARQQAASVGYEWRDTEALIKDASKALKEGNAGQALALAKKAKKQGELGYAQWKLANK